MSAKIPDAVYKEILLRIPEGDRSTFIREAIIEKIQSVPKPDKILELEQRLKKLEGDVSEVKRYLADLEMLTYEKGRANPHTFCMDEIDHKIVDFLSHYKGGTTPELAEYLKISRFTVLHRLRRLQKTTRKQLGRPIIDYYAGEKSGRKKAWWINDELVEP